MHPNGGAAILPLRKEGNVCAAACRREGSLPGLLKAWASIHITRTTSPDRPIPYRLV